MVVKAKKFTPEVLLSAPRRGPAVPNHDGTLALHSVSTYSFEDHEAAQEIRILDVRNGSSTLFTDDREAHDAVWLGDGTNAILWLQSADKGSTNLMIGDGDNPGNASYVADTIPAPFSNLKVKPLADGCIACVMTCLATPEGELYNEKTAEKPKSSARIYDKLIVRFWDRYITPQRQAVWYSKLVKSEGKFSLAAPVQNVLKGTEFECPFDTGMNYGASEFDISSTGILFNSWKLSEDPNVSSPHVYYVPLSTFVETDVPEPRQIDTGDFKGYTGNPRFSPCGERAALLVSATADVPFEQYLMLLPDLSTSLHAMDVWKFAGSPNWDLYPNGFEWSRDGKSLRMTADDCGRVKLFGLSLESLGSGEGAMPRALTQDGAISGHFDLGNSAEKILITSTSLIDNGTYSIIDSSEPENKTVVSSMSKNGLKLGLDPNQVSEMWFEGSGDYCVQTWVVKPSFFDENEKYPLALLIHGGPQDGWREAWSTRWNPAVWAEQGYICIMPNIIGSTGFGLEFAKGINNEWGGRAYKDLENCFQYVKDNMPFVDTDNAIAAGGSYGGYMVNWLQGNPLGRKFKAMVCHDGIFSTQMLLAGDMFDITGTSSFNGSMLPWKNFKNLEKHNPARHDLLANWKTPMLVIHSDLDYRCIVADGLAAFDVCQAQGTPSKFLNFPDEGHWVLKPENSLVWHKTVFDWINHYSGVSKKH